MSKSDDVHGHVYVRVVQKLYSGSDLYCKYTSAHQSLLLGETEFRYQGYVTLTGGWQASFHEIKTKLDLNGFLVFRMIDNGGEE